MSVHSLDPPVAKYRYTLEITGNSHEEIEHELLMSTRGGYLLDSEHYKRDEFKVFGGKRTSTLEHVNPEMTSEQYAIDLQAWSVARHVARREKKVDDVPREHEA